MRWMSNHEKRKDKSEKRIGANHNNKHYLVQILVVEYKQIVFVLPVVERLISHLAKGDIDKVKL